MSDIFKKNIKDWIHLDNELKLLNERVKKLRDKRNKIHNDIIRYVLFILIPFLVFLVSKLFFFKINIKTFLKRFKIDNQKIHVEKKIYYLFFILLGYIVFEFFSLNFPLHKIDIYHEGQRLSSAYKSLLDDSLWSGSYVTVGIIYETIGTSDVL